MASAASIPESQNSETSGSQSSSNAKTTNLKAQSSSEWSSESSSDPQKIRATAWSKLMKETKCIREALRALYPKFDSANN